ncbi:MAG: polysaccharide biosynthesis tyrosine autokinase [Gemmataceae bacterium]|nr:polysaccharide biosynthesis tyrosine autokinase [Gemmataceae bacterium]
MQSTKDNLLPLVPAVEAGAQILAPAVPPRQTGLALEAAPPSVLTSPPTPWALLVALKRRWLLALTLGLLGAAIGAAVAWYMLPVSWRARTLLHIASIRPVLIFENAEARTDFANYQRSQLALVRSRLVLNAALRDPEVAGLEIVQKQVNPVEWLEKELVVDFTLGAEIMSIGMAGDDPDAMNKLVNAVRAAYTKEILEKEQRLRSERLNQLRKLYSQYDDVLRDKRAKLKELAESLGSKQSKNLELRQKSLYAELEKLQSDLLGLQSQARKFQIELKGAAFKQKEADTFALPDELVEALLKKHPELIRLQDGIAEKQKRLQSLKERLRNPEKDQIFIATNEAIVADTKALEARRAQLRDDVAKQMRAEILAQVNNNMLTRKEQLALLKELENSLEGQINQKTLDIQRLNKQAVSLEWLEEEIQHTSEVHKKVGAQKEALQVEIDAPSRVSILEDAYAIQTRNQASRMRTAGMAGFGLFGLALLGVAFLEFRVRRVSGVGEVVYGLGLRLVGVLPHVPARALGQGASRQSDLRWQHMLMESIDSTRTMLVHAAKQDSLRVVMVTSALNGEGKTLLSSHLAVSLARAGFKTLLMDADLRRPSVYRIVDLPYGPGLSELLRDQVDLESVVRSGPLDNLSVITAGHWDATSIRLLAQRKLGEILDSVKSSYDFIIIDSAPILPAADTLLIGQHADGVLFSVLRDVSRLSTVHAAFERMSMLGIRILGAVVGGAAVDSYAYRYEPPAAAV